MKPSTSEDRSATVGVLYGLSAYGVWGLAPVYFKSVSSVPAFEVLAHRVIWSVVVLSAWLALRKRIPQLRAVLKNRKTLATLAVTTILIATNWLGFIWAVNNGFVKFASLGYFINPLFNVLLGVVFLKEHLRPVQWTCVAIAAAGVTVLLVQGPDVPAKGLALAFLLATSFGFYGLLRKTAPVQAHVGLCIETAMFFPIAAGYLVWLASNGAGTFGHVSRTTDLLLMAAGLMTALPLLWFNNAARRVHLATLGFMQYLAPTGHFLLAVLAYHEPLSRHELAGFCLIWLALAAYSIEAALRQRRSHLLAS